MDLQDVFIENLKSYRKQRNLRQLDLALEIDKGSNYINDIENKKFFPGPDTIQKIAQVLQIKPMQLFDENGCLDNALKNSKEELKNQIVNQLHALLKEDIKREVERVLG